MRLNSSQCSAPVANLSRAHSTPKARHSRRVNAWWQPVEQQKRPRRTSPSHPIRDLLRSKACKPYLRVIDSETAIAKFCTQGLDGRDRALARELASGTVRWYILLKAQLEPLLAKRLKDPNARRAALAGACIRSTFTRIPPHAAVSTSVELAKRVKLGRAAGLVNGVLRRFIREQDAIVATELPEACKPPAPDGLQPSLSDFWRRVGLGSTGNERSRTLQPADQQPVHL